ncbi:hypothetical protein C8J57DRAFT_1472587 [Mycena rebaudengoi]|nr:hypothetical protein C8J57DRAFT_1472587 [Mycena rebaudengoi]
MDVVSDDDAMLSRSAEEDENRLLRGFDTPARTSGTSWMTRGHDLSWMRELRVAGMKQARRNPSKNQDVRARSSEISKENVEMDARKYFGACLQNPSAKPTLSCTGRARKSIERTLSPIDAG